MKMLKVVICSLFFVVLIFVVVIYILYLNGYNVLNLPTYPKPLPKSSSVLSATSESHFYGMNVEMSQILPTSPSYVVNSQGHDLIDISSELGINMFRITNETGGVYSRNQWFSVLDKMQNKNIKAIILVEASSNNGDLYSINIMPVYLDLVRTYVVDNGILVHPNIYGVDIKNEPLLTDSNINMLKSARQIIKSKYPNTKVSVGWWRVDSGKFDKNGKPVYIWDDYEAGKKLDEVVDYYSLHLYGFEAKMLGFYPDPVLRTKQFLTKMKSVLQTNKPLIIEEFGASNGSAVSDTDTIGSPELQANTYRGVFQGLYDLNDTQFIGALGFQFYSRDKFNDAWAIVKDRGDFMFPATSVIKKYALDLDGDVLYTINNEAGILLNNSHNGKKIGVKTNEKIGLKIELPTSREYKLVSTSPDNIILVDPFHLRESNRNYYALFQIKNAGEQKISIRSRRKCTTNTRCPDYDKEVFTVRILSR